MYNKIKYIFYNIYQVVETQKFKNTKRKIFN